MTKKEIVQRKRVLEKAIKLNKNVIKYEINPNLKDIARYRVSLLNKKLTLLEMEYQKNYGTQ